MEARRSEPEFDDLEKLLCEIPNVTSANSHFGRSVPKMVCLDGEGRIPMNNFQQSPVKGVRTEEMNLPDERYNLTSAFGELRFSDEVPVEAQNSPSAKSLQNYATSLDGGFQTNVKYVPSYRSPNNVPYSFYGFDMPKGGHESANWSRLSSTPELRRHHQVANCPPFDNIAANVPSPLLSSMPVPGVHFPVMSDHQQLVMETQARLPYLNPQQMNQQHQINWRNMEEEQLYGMQQQYLHLQKLHNQHLENGNMASRLMSVNTRQPHFEVPISNQYEQFKQEPFWNGYGMPKNSNQSNLAFSPVELNAMKAWDKVGKQSYPDKILTRSLGLNTPNAVKFGSVGVNESRTHVIQNGKVHPNGHFLHSLSDSGCYQLDNVRSWDLYPDLIDLKRADLKSLPLKFNSLNEVTGKIYLMAKDQHGCRFLQRKFAEGTQEEIEMIFDEIIDHIVELMTDPFGNYLVQKLLEVCNKDQQTKILKSVTRNPEELVSISCDMHGTRAVQKIIETLRTPEQFSMVVSSLEPDAVALMIDMNGNHVAQKCLQHLMPEYNEFLFAAATVECVKLAKDRHGCCVLQKCLGHSDGERRRRLIHEIVANALILSQDPFGNYVVQFVFDLRLSWATEEILDQLDGSYGDLSVQKHSSNVVERCLKCADEERHTRIIQEIMDHPRLDQIMLDAFGNYVIQAVLNQSKGALYTKMVDAIKPHVPMLRNSPYGKKVLSCLGLRK